MIRFRSPVRRVRSDRRRLAFTAALVLAVLAAPVHRAEAAVISCQPGPERPGCYARVIGINNDGVSYLALHNEPDYTGGVISGTPHYRNGDVVLLQCWTTGAGDADGNGDHYWFYVSLGSYGGYLNDWYVDTGSFEDWHAHPEISRCS